MFSSLTDVLLIVFVLLLFFFFSSRRRHTRCALVTGVQTCALPISFLSFLPEQVDSYEVGYKGSLLDGAVNVALAAFYADYSDVQIPGSVACTVAGLPTFCGVVSNAGKASFKGLEFEIGRAHV